MNIVVHDFLELWFSQGICPAVGLLGHMVVLVLGVFFCFFVFVFVLTCLLEHICFTMGCYFLFYNKVNQLYIYIYPHISSFLHFPPTVPISPL